MNAREKGKRGERQWRDESRENVWASQARLEFGPELLTIASRTEVRRAGGLNE